MKNKSRWATNGGVYFGWAVNPTDPGRERSILDEEWRTSGNLNFYPNADDPENPGDRHLITIGPNGSGKSRRALIPNLLRLPDWSMVVVDVKGELAAYTAIFRAEHGRVVIIDPFGVMQKNYPGLCRDFPFFKSSGFNPLSALDPESDDFPDDAMALAEALIREQGNEPHWSQSAQDLVAALLMYVRATNPSKGSLADVREILGRPNLHFRETIREMLTDEIAETCEELAIKAARYADLNSENKELNSIISAALTQTRWLDSKPIKADLARGEIDFSSLKRVPTTVYLVLPPRYLATHSTWLRVLITSCLMPLLRSTEDVEVPVLFMLDEFAQLGPMQVIEKNLALMRGYGVKLWFVLQDLVQLKALYGERWESFVGNAGVVHSFAPQDATTRDYLSKLSPLRLYWLTAASASSSMNTGAQASLSKGTSEAEQHFQGPAYWPHGLGAMATGNAVLFSRGRVVRSWFPDPEEEQFLGGDEMKKARAHFSDG